MTKTVKTFLATWRPARGVIRVVSVEEEDGWLALLSTKAEATAAEVLEAAADRDALEQGFKAVKEVWGAGQQQVRNIDSSEGCFNLNLWMMSIVEAWTWDKGEEELAERDGSPWDNQPRRPSHADKRKALQREILRAKITTLLAQTTPPRRWAKRFLPPLPPALRGERVGVRGAWPWGDRRLLGGPASAPSPYPSSPRKAGEGTGMGSPRNLGAVSLQREVSK